MSPARTSPRARQASVPQVEHAGRRCARSHAARPPPASAKRRSAGFTLLEVLLAVVLFALAVSVLAAAYINIIQSLESVKTDHALEQEVRWIRSQVLLEPDLEVLEKGGETRTLDLGAARWDVVVQPTAVADLFQVQLHVVLGDDKATLREQTETFQVLRPSWSDPIERDKLRSEAKMRIEEGRREQGIVAAKRR